MNFRKVVSWQSRRSGRHLVVIWMVLPWRHCMEYRDFSYMYIAIWVSTLSYSPPYIETFYVFFFIHAPSFVNRKLNWEASWVSLWKSKRMESTEFLYWKLMKHNITYQYWTFSFFFGKKLNKDWQIFTFSFYLSKTLLIVIVLLVSSQFNLI